MSKAERRQARGTPEWGLSGVLGCEACSEMRECSARYCQQQVRHPHAQRRIGLPGGLARQGRVRGIAPVQARACPSPRSFGVVDGFCVQQEFLSLLKNSFCIRCCVRRKEGDEERIVGRRVPTCHHIHAEVTVLDVTVTMQQEGMMSHELTQETRPSLRFLQFQRGVDVVCLT